jgi:hypothetical protein
LRMRVHRSANGAVAMRIDVDRCDEDVVAA